MEVIDTGTSVSGDLTLSGSHDFGADLVGAKIWLVPTSFLTGGTPNLITGWPDNQATFLFETHIIYYNDTDVP